MSGSFPKTHELTSKEVSEIVREARRMRAEAFKNLITAVGRGVLRWHQHQPTAPFAGSLSGRAR